jgi:hypothetical protein
MIRILQSLNKLRIGHAESFDRLRLNSARHIARVPFPG